jgi:hypothetical protein
MANPYVIKGAIDAALGVGQLVGGALMKVKRPNYSRPSEINQNQQLAKNLYGASTLYGVPGQGAINNQNAQTYATNLRAIRESQQNPAAMLAGLTATTANQMQTNAKMGLQAAADRRNAINAAAARLMGANQTSAQFADKEFQLNQYEPFKAKAATKSALLGAGLQNLAGGATSLAGAKSKQDMDNMYKDWFKKQSS